MSSAKNGQHAHSSSCGCHPGSGSASSGNGDSGPSYPIPNAPNTADQTPGRDVEKLAHLTKSQILAPADAVPGQLIKSLPSTFSDLSSLLEVNRVWAQSMTSQDPSFFSSLANQQAPQLLWIGCSDSRVPANQLINLQPGEVFVHRNIANVVNHTDLNCLSVMQYAVDVLRVKHIIVTGHYGCGGVAASMTNRQFGLIDNWLRSIKDVYQANEKKIEALPDHKSKVDLMCELNVANSVRNVCATTIVQNAWQRGQELSVHGWCYRLEDGLIRDLDISVSSVSQVSRIYDMVSCKKSAST